jgi:hypothetical protein
MKTTALLLTFVFAIVTVQPALADSDKGQNQNAEEQIKKLMDCYALGSDIITRAIDADSVGADLGNPVNLVTSPIFAEGHGFYRRCATREWEVTLQVDSGGTLLTTHGPLEWANFHNNGSRADGRRNMQHLIRPVSVEVKGNRGVIEAYSIIHVMFLPDSPSAGTVEVITITYTSHVVRNEGGWLLDKTNLNVTSISTSTALL